MMKLWNGIFVLLFGALISAAPAQDSPPGLPGDDTVAEPHEQNDMATRSSAHRARITVKVLFAIREAICVENVWFFA